MPQERQDNQYVIVGKIHRTYGVHGDLRVNIYVPNLKLPDTVYIKTPDNKFKPLNISKYSPSKGLIRFKGFEVREKAKNLTNHYIYLEKEKLPKLEKDTFYEFQLLDMDVEYNGKIIGKIIKIDDRLYPAYLIIKCVDDKVRHLPFIDEFVKEIDIEKGKMVVDLPEGWFSLWLSYWKIIYLNKLVLNLNERR